jgi:hypothetical protein
MAKKPRTDRYGNSLPQGIYERGDKYYVLLTVDGRYGQHGSFGTLDEALQRVAEVKYGSGPVDAAPAIAAPIETPIEPNKELLLLQIRNEIASKEAYIAIANMETRAGIEWTNRWDNGWIKSGKEVKRLIALFYGDKK